MILSPGNIVEFQAAGQEIAYPYTFHAKIISYDPEENKAIVETNKGEEELDLQEINYCYTIVEEAPENELPDLSGLTPEQIEQIRSIVNASNE